MFGTTVTCLMALLYCAVFGFNDPSTVDPKLLAPVIRKYLKPKPNHKDDVKYDSVSLDEINNQND